MATRRDPSTIARTTSARTGSPRNSAKRAASAAIERSPQPDRVVTGRERPASVPSTPGRPPGETFDHDAGGRNPRSDRMAWPSRPASQVRNAVEASWSLRRGLDDHAAGVAGTFASRVPGPCRPRRSPWHRSRRRCRRRLRPESQLADRCRPDVLLLRHDVRGVARLTKSAGSPGSFARFSTSWVAYLVIGTLSPAAMTLIPDFARSIGDGDPGRVGGRHDDRQLVRGEGDRVAIGKPFVNEFLGIGRVGRQEHVGGRTLLDLCLEGGRRVGRDRERRPRVRRFVGRLGLVQGPLE